MLAFIVLLPAPGASAGENDAWEITGGLTVVGLYANADDVDDEVTASGDVFVTREGERGRWFLYVEGNTSLDRNGISTVFPEANADGGTALDRDRHGRIQISELNYRARLSEKAALTLGLIDPSAYLDRSRITNDENVLFLGVGFVNNPTIEFPDYTLGAAFEGRMGDEGLRLNAVIASSNGLADNPNVSYSELVSVGDSGKGVFAGAGLGWVTEAQVARIGAWVNTRPHETIDGDSSAQANYGVYAVYGRTVGSHALSARAGMARSDVSLAAGFASLAYLLRWGDHALGAGVARTFLSSDAGDTGDDTTQVEAFARLALRGERVHITPAIQYLHHSSFVDAAGDPRRSAWIATVRAHYAF